MSSSYLKKIKNKLTPIVVGRRNPVTGGLLYLIMNKSLAWFILCFMVLGAFIVLVNAVLEWSNENSIEAIIIAGGIIVSIFLSLFVIKNKRTSVFLFLLFGSVCSAYLYYAAPEAEEVTQVAIEKGVEIYGGVKKSVQ